MCGVREHAHSKFVVVSHFSSILFWFQRNHPRWSYIHTIFTFNMLCGWVTKKDDEASSAWKEKRHRISQPFCWCILARERKAVIIIIFEPSSLCNISLDNVYDGCYHCKRHAAWFRNRWAFEFDRKRLFRVRVLRLLFFSYVARHSHRYCVCQFDFDEPHKVAHHSTQYWFGHAWTLFVLYDVRTPKSIPVAADRNLCGESLWSITVYFSFTEWLFILWLLYLNNRKFPSIDVHSAIR